jgi:hypothetical protein
MNSPKGRLQLQLPPSQIRELAARYAWKDDSEALVAGHHIAAGDHSRAKFYTIFMWKTRGRGKSRLAHNTDVET